MSSDGVDGMVCRCKKCRDVLRAEVERLRAEVARLGGVVFADGTSLLAWVELRTEVDRWQRRAEAVTAVARGLRDACQAVEDGKPTDP